MRPLPPLIAILLAGACADLEPIRHGVCGNGVVDPGEDCDGDDACKGCRFRCVVDGDCPEGRACEASGACSAPPECGCHATTICDDAGACVDARIDPVGRPIWKVAGPYLFSYGGDFNQLIDGILAASYHPAPSGGLAIDAAHAAPYDRLWFDLLGAAGYHDTREFVLTELPDPGGIGLCFALVPGIGAPRGSSPDGLSAPILPQAIFPLEVAFEVSRNGAAFARVTQSTVIGPGHYRPPLAYDGWSHLLGDFFTVQGAPGTYTLRVAARDVGGAGWDLTVPFAIR